MILQIVSVLVLMVTAALCAPGGERQNMRLARDDKPQERPPSSGTLDPIGGGNLVKLVDDRDLQEQFLQSLERGGMKKDGMRQNIIRLAREDKSPPEQPPRPSYTLDSIGGGNLLGLLDPYTNGLLLSLERTQLLDSLDSYQKEESLSMQDDTERMVLKTDTKYPERMLDSVNGWALGESKRQFDEIDNVGFSFEFDVSLASNTTGTDV